VSPRHEIQLDSLGERIAALPGVERVRRAAAGLDAYLVGGSVRDALLGLARADLDVVVDEGDHLELARRLGGEVRAFAPFLTASVETPDGPIDVAAARAEAYPRPGALPEVRAATLAQDLARRDFTVNAVAVPLTDHPVPIDPHGGIGDLQAGRLRVLHERSFVDDPTRALRAARYAARLDLEPEPATLELLRQADLTTVSADRVEAELRRIACEPEPRPALERLAGWGLVALTDGQAELAERAARVAEAEPWAGVADRAEAVLAAIEDGSVRVSQLAESRPNRPSEAVEAARGRSPTELLLARALGADWLDRYVAEWRHVRLAISGNDLIGAGIPQGPAIGRGLAAALRAKLDGEVESREQELDVALEAARG
jgi:tRNA nucleotidyltransferase (CCA-adding enzyme)